MNIIIVVDQLRWGGHRVADIVSEMCSKEHTFKVTDIKGLESGQVQPTKYDLVMSWIDSSEEAVYKKIKGTNTIFASRVPGWKSAWRAAQKPLQLREMVRGVVCCNSELAQAAEKIYPNAKVQTIMNGVDPKMFFPREDGKLGVFWGWVGRMQDEQKNVPMMQEIKSKLSRPVKIMTQTWKDGKIQAVKWPEEMNSYYQSLYGWFRTSNFEGSSNALLEACACGLPVVATPTGVAFKIIDPEFLCTCAKHMLRKIKKLNKMPELAAKLGRENRATILRSWKWIDRKQDYLQFFSECTWP